MRLQPKKVLLTSKKLTDALKSIFDSEEFHRGAEVAMTEMALTLSETDDPEKSSANWHRMEGAKTFLNTLLNVVQEIPEPEKKPVLGKLNPNA